MIYESKWFNKENSLQMQAVGSEVLIAIAIPLVTLTILALYYRNEIRQFIAIQTNDAIRIQENQQERRRRQNRIEDQICSICLSDPKIHEVSSTCSHSFCGDCILSMYQHNNQQIKCPLCRQNITLLFKLFQSSEETKQVEARMTHYNSLFDDQNRSLYRRIVQFPYTLKRMWRTFFSVGFLVFFLRGLQITRWIFIIIVYILVPFDLLPQKMLGVIGYIDDFLFIMLILVFVLTLAAMKYYRNNQSG